MSVSIKRCFLTRLTTQIDTPGSIHLQDYPALCFPAVPDCMVLLTEPTMVISDDTSRCITLIINQSLTSGIFSDKLKIAKVTPIYKTKMTKKQVTNYIGITCGLKNIETMIADQLNAYFIETHLFSSQQYGLRKKCSTELAAIKLLDRLLDQLNQQ